MWTWDQCPQGHGKWVERGCMGRMLKVVKRREAEHTNSLSIKTTRTDMTDLRSSETWQALSESSSDFLEAFQKTVHVGTALVSVSTSVLLGVWLPKLLVDTGKHTETEHVLSLQQHENIFVTSIALCSQPFLWLQAWKLRLLSFCNDIEIHRKGYMKIMLEARQLEIDCKIEWPCISWHAFAVMFITFIALQYPCPGARREILPGWGS